MDVTQTDAHFTIDAFDDAPYDVPEEGPKLSRVTVRKTYHGVIEGSGVAEVLLAHGEGSGYVASERVVGSLDGRTGSFVIQHGGLAQPDGSTSTYGTIIPSSGTGALSGIAGEATEDAQGVLSLRYTLG